jgi:hypothetical protein
MNLHSEGSIGPARSSPGGSSAFRVSDGYFAISLKSFGAARHRASLLLQLDQRRLARGLADRAAH